LPLFCVISPNSVASEAHYVKVVEDVVVKKFTFAISSPDEFLVICYDTVAVIVYSSADGVSVKLIAENICRIPT